MATGAILTAGYQTLLDNSGFIVPGGLVWTYNAGTTTPQATYSDGNLTVLNTNPIVCDAAGRWIAYVPLGTTYKLVLETAATPPTHGATIRTVDNIAVPLIPQWTLNTYNAANYSTGVGTGTFTVDPADQQTYQYLVDGKRLFLQVVLNSISVSGSVQALRIALPAGLTTAPFQQTGAATIYDGGLGGVSGVWVTGAGGSQTYIDVRRTDTANWQAATNTSFVWVNALIALQ